MHYVLFYDCADDYLERRGQFRNQHLKHAWAAQARGELVLGGAFADPADSAMLLFQAASPQVVEDFAKSDPYVVSGLVRHWRVRLWNTVAGQGATNIIRPD